MKCIVNKLGNSYFFADGEAGRLLAKVEREAVLSKDKYNYVFFHVSSYQRGAVGSGLVQKDLGTYLASEPALNAIEKELGGSLSGLYS